MNKQQFIDHYVATFLASYMATHYDHDCLHGHINERYNNQPLEDALFCAECAWEQLQTTLNGKMIKENFKTDSRVEFHSTASELDGKTGTILGISSSHAECNFWIIGLDEPLLERRAVVIIDSCLKLNNS